jgi:hypothetical protein
LLQRKSTKKKQEEGADLDIGGQIRKTMLEPAINKSRTSADAA